jgi:hypothetical protein
LKLVQEDTGGNDAKNINSIIKNNGGDNEQRSKYSDDDDKNNYVQKRNFI